MMFMILGLSYHFRSTCFVRLRTHHIFLPYIIYLGSVSFARKWMRGRVQVYFRKRFYLCLERSQTTIMPFNVQVLQALEGFWEKERDEWVWKVYGYNFSFCVVVVFMMHKNTLNYGNFDLIQWLILYEGSFVVRQKTIKGNEFIVKRCLLAQKMCGGMCICHDSMTPLILKYLLEKRQSYDEKKAVWSPSKGVACADEVDFSKIKVFLA